MEQVVKTGRYLYAGEIWCDLRITYSSTRYGSGDPVEPPEQDEKRDSYYLQYGGTQHRGVFIGGSGCFDTLEEAMRHAAQTMPGVVWDPSPPPSVTFIKVLVVALVLPTLIGVVVFTVIALLPSAPITDFDPNLQVGIRGTIPTAIVFGAFFGAAYGPVLIPVAAMLLLMAERCGAPRLTAYWALIILAVAAAALSYGWALDAVELP